MNKTIRFVFVVLIFVPLFTACTTTGGTMSNQKYLGAGSSPENKQQYVQQVITDYNTLEEKRRAEYFAEKKVDYEDVQLQWNRLTRTVSIWYRNKDPMGMNVSSVAVFRTDEKGQVIAGPLLASTAQQEGIGRFALDKATTVTANVVTGMGAQWMRNQLCEDGDCGTSSGSAVTVLTAVEASAGSVSNSVSESTSGSGGCSNCGTVSSL